MIRFHFKRQVQVSHEDVEAQMLSVDVELPEVEKVLDSREQTGTYGSNWIFIGIERLQ